MLSVAVFLLGAALTAAVLYDFLRTTISRAGLGPMSARVAAAGWAIARLSARRIEKITGRTAREAIGPLILTGIAVMWIALNLLGYVLMFSAGDSLTHPDIGSRANLPQRTAYAGSTISTFGGSIVRPVNEWWDLLSMLAAVNGMVVLTLSVAFVLNVANTTGEMRALALRVNAILDHEETGLREGRSSLANLGTDLCRVAVNLRSAPLACFFATDAKEISFPEAILRLIDALESRHALQKDTEHAELRRGLASIGTLSKRFHAGRSGHGGDELDVSRAWARSFILT